MHRIFIASIAGALLVLTDQLLTYYQDLIAILGCMSMGFIFSSVISATIYSLQSLLFRSRYHQLFSFEKGFSIFYLITSFVLYYLAWQPSFRESGLDPEFEKIKVNFSNHSLYLASCFLLVFSITVWGRKKPR